MRILLVVVLFFNLFDQNGVKAQLTKNNETICSGIYTFVSNTTWPNTNTLSEISVGVLDDDTDLYQQLTTRYTNLKINGKVVNFYRFASLAEIKPTQALYIAKRYNREIEKVVDAVRGCYTLIITNVCRDERYTMINFNSAFRRKEFAVFPQNIEKAGLSMTEGFFDFAKGEIGWHELYVQTNLRLENEKLRTAKQRAELVRQKETIRSAHDTLLLQAGTIDRQQLEITQQKQILLLQNRILYLLAFAVALVAGILFLVVYGYLQKKKANKIILLRNEQLQNANREINNQNTELSRQHDLVVHQKKQIEELYIRQTESIRYAWRIQNALMPSEKLAQEILNDQFSLLYKPKDIVSGDFFLAEQRNDLTFIAIGDCTGHGVPGAFMSILAITFLKEIIHHLKITQPNLILSEMRRRVIAALKQQNTAEAPMDGLDISLLAINHQTQSCVWAGANNPILHYSVGDKQLRAIKPDKQPIAMHPVMGSFTQHVIPVAQNDMLYLFTDGFPDQFGGPKGKKFLRNRFTDLIEDICAKDLVNQFDTLSNALVDWQTGYGEYYEQTDDITVMCLKVEFGKQPMGETVASGWDFDSTILG